MRGWVVVIIAIVCLVVGGIGGTMLGGGAGAGFGIVAGLLSGSQAGVCLAVEPAIGETRCKELRPANTRSVPGVIGNTVSGARSPARTPATSS